MRFKRTIGMAIAAIVLVVVTSLFSHFSTPFDPLHNDGYQFWSGIGGDAFIATWAVVWWRRHNCHVEGCLRLAWHPTRAGDIVCRRHHPEGQRSHIDILSRHEDAKISPPAQSNIR